MREIVKLAQFNSIQFRLRRLVSWFCSEAGVKGKVLGEE